jgi:hypothetical protein
LKQFLELLNINIALITMIEEISIKEQIRYQKKKKKICRKLTLRVWLVGNFYEGIFIFLWDKIGTFGKH